MKKYNRCSWILINPFTRFIFLAITAERMFSRRTLAKNIITTVWMTWHIYYKKTNGFISIKREINGFINNGLKLEIH